MLQFNAFIEISPETGSVKYEFDKVNGYLKVDRILYTSMVYPAHYGYILDTLAGDGDPMDVLIYASKNLMPCSVVNIKIIGGLLTEDEAGIDPKIIAVPTAKVDPFLSHIQSYKDLNLIFLEQIEHFFQHYKDLEKNKHCKINGWIESEEATQIVTNSKLNS